MPNLSHDNIRLEIEACVQALARIGLEVYVVNVTHPRLGIPAVYTIIPGAHFRDRTRHTGVLFHLVKLVSMMEDPEEAAGHLQKIAQFSRTVMKSTFSWASPWRETNSRKRPWVILRRPCN